MQPYDAAAWGAPPGCRRSSEPDKHHHDQQQPLSPRGHRGMSATGATTTEITVATPPQGAENHAAGSCPRCLVPYPSESEGQRQLWRISQRGLGPAGLFGGVRSARSRGGSHPTAGGTFTIPRVRLGCRAGGAQRRATDGPGLFPTPNNTDTNRSAMGNSIHDRIRQPPAPATGPERRPNVRITKPGLRPFPSCSNTAQHRNLRRGPENHDECSDRYLGKRLGLMIPRDHL